MAVKLVRAPSATPNIYNTDDFVGLRYSYGDNNGYVKGRGNECDYERSGLNFTIKSGRLVLQGVEVDVPSGGETIAINMGAQYVASTIYLEVNLATNTAIIGRTYNTSTTRPVVYPKVNGGDDLTTNTTGTARMELYHVLSLRAGIVEVTKLVKDIPYSGEALRGYDLTKGTIEERLDALGFKLGSVALKNGTKESDNYWTYTYTSTDTFGTATTTFGVTFTKNELRRQGNYVITNIEMRVSYVGDSTYHSDNVITFELGKNFKNLENQNIKIACEYSGDINGSQQTLYRDAEMAITSGEFNLTPASSGYLPGPDRIYYINIGDEAEAL